MTKFLGAVTIVLAACAGTEVESVERVGGFGAAPADEVEGGTLAGATAERPCAERTVAGIELPNGNRMAFCVLASGTEMFVESGPLGRPAWRAVGAGAGVSCGLDLFLAATAADVPVPAALVNACPPEQRVSGLAARAIVDGGVFQPVRAEGGLPRTNYCNHPDDVFIDERCPEMQCAPYEDCVDWCEWHHWGWHWRNMSGSDFLGEEGNVAFETNASCGGSTRVRQYEREDVGDAWGSPDSDYWVSSGYWATSGFIFHSGLFGQDYDFRLRADSNTGAWHRHTGYFLDE